MSKQFLLAALAGVLAVSAGGAQGADTMPVGRHAGSIAFAQSRPQGALQHNIGLGYGGDLSYMLRLDKLGAVSLRANLGFLSYGRESFDTPFSTTVGGRVLVRVTTTNQFMPLSIGPQLMWPRGAVRPYVNAGIGAQYFYTQSSVRDTDSDSDDDDIASTTNQSDWTSAWVAGGGIYIPVTKNQRVPVSLDFGVQYYAGGTAQYLRPGSIVDVSDTEILITPLESETHLMLVRIGVKLGF